MSENEKNRAAIYDLIEGITSGRLLESFDRHYGDDVVMRENGADDPGRVGKAKNRAYEEYFVANSEWFGVKVGPVIADGDRTAYQMWMDLAFQGQRMQRTQWAVQTWKDGKIVEESFWYQG